jgi:hypothetical protein
MAIARVIVGSLVVHAAVLVLLDVFVDGTPRASATKRPPMIEIVEPLVEVEVAPVEIALVVPPAPAVAPARIARAPIASRPRAAAPATTAISTSAPAELPAQATETPSADPPAPVGPGRSMNMRARGTGPDLTVHQDVPHETAPRATETTSESKLRPDGTDYVVPDLVTTMHVSQDGRARFHDKPDIEVKVRIPRPPSMKQIGDHLQRWYRDPYAQKNARRYQDMPRHEQAVPGGWDAGAGGDTHIDGRIKAPEELPGGLDSASRGSVPLIGGKLDITSWLHRKFIGDPYSSRKRVLLDGTHEERAKIRERYTKEQLDDSAITMRKNVERVFHELRDPAMRKAALFALWDECAEGEGPDGEAGERARAIVIGAIRGRLVGEAGYTSEEIVAFDTARTSLQHFAPYAN